MLRYFCDAVCSLLDVLEVTIQAKLGTVIYTTGKGKTIIDYGKIKLVIGLFLCNFAGVWL